MLRRTRVQAGQAGQAGAGAGQPQQPSQGTHLVVGVQDDVRPPHVCRGELRVLAQPLVVDVQQGAVRHAAGALRTQRGLELRAAGGRAVPAVRRSARCGRQRSWRRARTQSPSRQRLAWEYQGG